MNILGIASFIKLGKHLNVVFEIPFAHFCHDFDIIIYETKNTIENRFENNKLSGTAINPKLNTNNIIDIPIVATKTFRNPENNNGVVIF